MQDALCGRSRTPSSNSSSDTRDLWRANRRLESSSRSNSGSSQETVFEYAQAASARKQAQARVRARSSSPRQLGGLNSASPLLGFAESQPQPTRSVSVPSLNFSPRLRHRCSDIFCLTQLTHDRMPPQNNFDSCVAPAALTPQSGSSRILPSPPQIRSALNKLESALSGLRQDAKNNDDVYTPTTLLPCSTPDGRTRNTTPSPFVTPSPREAMANDLSWLDLQIDNAAKNRALCEKQAQRFAEWRMLGNEIAEDGENCNSTSQRHRILELEQLLAEKKDIEKVAEKNLSEEQSSSHSLLLQNRKVEKEIMEAELSTQNCRQQCSKHEKTLEKLRELVAHAEADMAAFTEQSSRLEAEKTRLASQLKLVEMSRTEEEQENVAADDEYRVAEVAAKQEHIDLQRRRVAELQTQVASLRLERKQFEDLEETHLQRIQQLEKDLASNSSTLLGTPGQWSRHTRAMEQLETLLGTPGQWSSSRKTLPEDICTERSLRVKINIRGSDESFE